MRRSLPYGLVMLLITAFTLAGPGEAAGAAPRAPPHQQTPGIPTDVLGKDWHLTTYQYAKATPLDMRQGTVNLTQNRPQHVGQVGNGSRFRPKTNRLTSKIGPKTRPSGEAFSTYPLS